MIKKIAVVGRDADAWLTALLLQLALARSEASMEITLVELPSQLTKHDVISAEHSLRAFHDLLGLSDNELISASRGTPSFAQRFSRWGGKEDFMHPYDSAGAEIEGQDFFQCWVKAFRSGMNVNLEEFSVGAMVAKCGKMLSLSENAKSYSRASYGYNLSAIDYLKYIAKIALAAGLRHIPAEIEFIEKVDGFISSVVLTSGEAVSADLFVDASGIQGELIDELRVAALDSYQHFFPFSRQVLASASKLEPLPSFTQHTAFHSGHVSIHPLIDRTAINVCIDPAFTDIKTVPELIMNTTGFNVNDLAVRDRKSGHRRDAWVNNCVAVGGTLATLDTLDGVQPYVLHTSLSYLITLLSDARSSPIEANYYNETMACHVENIRDFQLCHYALNKRPEKYWQDLRGIDIPESLEERISVFSGIGKITLRENELFDANSWQYMLTGMGIVPEAHSALVNRIEDQYLISQFQSMLKFVASEVQNMPDLQSYFEVNASEPSHGAMF